MITTKSPILSSEHTDFNNARRAIHYITHKNAGAGPYTATDMGLFVGMYFFYCKDVGVDPVIAVAQMSLETNALTSWWCSPPRNNPAGIGVTGRVEKIKPAHGSWQMDTEGRFAEGVAFPSWLDAVEAHVGRLLAYSSVIYRDEIERALRWRPLPGKYLGSAIRLADLSGKWAVDGRYAEKIADVAKRILAAPVR